MMMAIGYVIDFLLCLWANCNIIFDQVVHAYYQWVPFMLFLQGVMFYVPHYLWKTFEDKKMQKITSGLRGKTFNTDGRRDACENLINYLWETKGRHNAYAFK